MWPVMRFLVLYMFFLMEINSLNGLKRSAAISKAASCDVMSLVSVLFQ